MAVTSISLSSIKNYTDDLTKDKFDSLNFVSFDGGELATVSGDSIYNIILGNNDTAGSLAYRISAAENDILTLNNKLGDGFSDTATVTAQFSAAKERITTAEETAQAAANTLDTFLTVADGKDFLFLLDDLTVPVGRLDKVTDGSYLCYNRTSLTSWNIPLPELTNGSYMYTNCPLKNWSTPLPKLANGSYMFKKTNLSKWNIDLQELENGRGMFSNCNQLSEINCALDKLKIGGEDSNNFNHYGQNGMFSSCPIKNWTINLPSLKNGTSMFGNCTDLENFDGALDSLEIGGASGWNGMFGYCKKLTNWHIQLPSLRNGNTMFSDCISIQNWNIELPELISRILYVLWLFGVNQLDYKFTKDGR